MTSTKVPLWHREIRRYTVLLLALVTMFGVVTTGYVLWDKKSSEELLLVIDNFHLASAFHSAAARDETRRLLVHLHWSPMAMAASPDSLTSNDFNVAVSVSLIQDRVDAVLALQDHFSDPRFASLIRKVGHDFVTIEKQISESQPASESATPALASRLSALMIALNQLERMHVIVYEERMAERDAQKDRGVLALLAFIAVVFLIGSVSVRQGLRAIEAIISHQREVEERLREAKAEAESANAAKTEFLAAMSHELRTPLNSVLGFSQMLGSPMISPITERRRMEYARDIQRAGEHLLALVEDVLDLSKIEAGEVVLAETAFDVGEVLQDAVHIIQGLAEKRAVKVDLNLNPNLPMIFADKRRVTQIVVNLLSNAVKFNRAGGYVQLFGWVGARNVLAISVSDSGVGIPSADVSRVFEPFVQLRSSVRVSHEGTGLGLSLSKKLAELHSGSVALESKLGVGTTATVLFPPERTIQRSAA